MVFIIAGSVKTAFIRGCSYALASDGGDVGSGGLPVSSWQN